MNNYQKIKQHYSLNQKITKTCYSDKVVNLKGFDGLYVIKLVVTEDFNNLDQLYIGLYGYNAGKILISYNLHPSCLLSGCYSELKIKVKEKLTYTKLIYDVIGKNPTKGSITVAIERCLE